MKTWAILATGPSMSQAVADSVRGRCGVIAVNDAYRLAPWADALVANDAKWWRYHSQALRFAGRRFCSSRIVGTEPLPPSARHSACCNSGLQAMRVARDVFGAQLIVLLGYDQRGLHFFGAHPQPLRNTSAQRRAVHQKQFAAFDTTKCQVVNCTPGSALQCFPMGDLDLVLPAREAAA